MKDMLSKVIGKAATAAAVAASSSSSSFANNMLDGQPFVVDVLVDDGKEEDQLQDKTKKRHDTITLDDTFDLSATPYQRLGNAPPTPVASSLRSKTTKSLKSIASRWDNEKELKNSKKTKASQKKVFTVAGGRPILEQSSQLVRARGPPRTKLTSADLNNATKDRSTTTSDSDNQTTSICDNASDDEIVDENDDTPQTTVREPQELAVYINTDEVSSTVSVVSNMGRKKKVTFYGIDDDNRKKNNNGSYSDDDSKNAINNRNHDDYDDDDDDDTVSLLFDTDSHASSSALQFQPVMSIVSGISDATQSTVTNDDRSDILYHWRQQRNHNNKRRRKNKKMSSFRSSSSSTSRSTTHTGTATTKRIHKRRGTINVPGLVQSASTATANETVKACWKRRLELHRQRQQKESSSDSSRSNEEETDDTIIKQKDEEEFIFDAFNLMTNKNVIEGEPDMIVVQHSINSTDEKGKQEQRIGSEKADKSKRGRRISSSVSKGARRKKDKSCSKDNGTSNAEDKKSDHQRHDIEKRRSSRPTKELREDGQDEAKRTDKRVSTRNKRGDTAKVEDKIGRHRRTKITSDKDVRKEDSKQRRTRQSSRKCTKKEENTGEGRTDEKQELTKETKRIPSNKEETRESSSRNSHRRRSELPINSTTVKRSAERDSQSEGTMKSQRDGSEEKDNELPNEKEKTNQKSRRPTTTTNTPRHTRRKEDKEKDRNNRTRSCRTSREPSSRRKKLEASSSKRKDEDKDKRKSSSIRTSSRSQAVANKTEEIETRKASAGERNNDDRRARTKSVQRDTSRRERKEKEKSPPSTNDSSETTKETISSESVNKTAISSTATPSESENNVIQSPKTLSSLSSSSSRKKNIIENEANYTEKTCTETKGDDIEKDAPTKQNQKQSSETIEHLQEAINNLQAQHEALQEAVKGLLSTESKEITSDAHKVATEAANTVTTESAQLTSMDRYYDPVSTEESEVPAIRTPPDVPKEDEYYSGGGMINATFKLMNNVASTIRTTTNLAIWSGMNGTGGGTSGLQLTQDEHVGQKSSNSLLNDNNSIPSFVDLSARTEHTNLSDLSSPSEKNLALIKQYITDNAAFASGNIDTEQPSAKDCSKHSSNGKAKTRRSWKAISLYSSSRPLTPLEKTNEEDPAEDLTFNTMTSTTIASSTKEPHNGETNSTKDAISRHVVVSKPEGWCLTTSTCKTNVKTNTASQSQMK